MIKKIKIILSVLTILFVAAGLIRPMPNMILLSPAFTFLMAIILINVKECFDNGDKRYGWINVGAAVFVCVVIVINFLSGWRGKSAAAITIIGGADGPTSIFIAGKLGTAEHVFVGVIILLVLTWSIYRIIKRGK